MPTHKKVILRFGLIAGRQQAEIGQAFNSLSPMDFALWCKNYGLSTPQSPFSDTLSLCKNGIPLAYLIFIHPFHAAIFRAHLKPEPPAPAPD
jgi:hypothetical protein